MIQIIVGLWLFIAALKDIKTRQVNVWLVVLAASGGLLLGIFNGWPGFAQSLAGLVVGLVFIGASWLTKGAIGVGDGLLIGGLGAMVGIKALFKILCLGFGFGGVLGALLILFKKCNRKDELPMVPLLFMGYIGALSL